jgi:beta-galactosidase
MEVFSTMRKNISVDIVRTDKPLILDDLLKYKILFMPFQVVVSKETAGLLIEYVRKGGWLVADARMATIDNYDFGYPVNPGAGLDEVFGVKRMDWLGREEPILVTVKENKLFNGYFDESFELKGKWYKEKVVISDGTRILATFNEDSTPAMVLNKYGEGKAILAAFPLSGSYRLTKDENIQKYLVALAGIAGIQPDAKLETNKPTIKCMIKVHQLNNKKIIYVCNTSNEIVRGEIHLPAISDDFKKAKEIISERNLILNINTDTYSFPVYLLPQKSAVYLLE